MENGVVIKADEQQTKVFLNGMDITQVVLDVSIHRKNGMFVVSLDIPLNKADISQDIKIM